MGSGDHRSISEALPADHRRAERRETMAASTLRADGIRPIDVTILDISTSGFRLATAESLPISSEISIGLPGFGTRRAYIAWRQSDRYGCAFHAPITEYEAERAFATPSIVPLGTAHAVVTRRDTTSDSLMTEHNHWYMPLDAILVALGYVGLAAAGLWHWLG